MTYRALYRVWRPQTFSDFVGQEHVVRTLQNALKEQRLSHAYLFSGPRGTGKTSAAKVMAKAVNCEHGPTPEPCNDCKQCRAITDGSLLDVLEIDAASNRGIEEIRDLREKVKYAPTEVRKKVYIIDEVHMLTQEAFNALLKTLEEPPEHVLFILATTEPHKLPPTIVSRCQRFDFHRIPIEEIVNRLRAICREESIPIEERALLFIAQLAEGGLRDALSLLDQAYSFGHDEITEADVRAIVGMVASSFFDDMLLRVKKQDRSGILDAIARFIQEGHDPEKCVDDLLHYLRDLLLVKTAPTLPVTEERLRLHGTLKQVAEQFTEEEIFAMMEEVNLTQQKMKWGSRPRVLLELLFVKLTTLPKRQQGADVLERLEQLEEKVRRLSERAGEAGVREKEATAAPRKDSLRSSFSPGTLKKVEAVRRKHDSQLFDELKGKWKYVLAGVKERKITVYAWLVDGEPAAACDSHIVLVFKNFIHRETTDKPGNKQLIEEVIERVLGKRYELVTCMQNEWQKLEAEGGIGEQAATRDNEKDRHVQKAIELFGEDLVEIED